MIHSFVCASTEILSLFIVFGHKSSQFLRSIHHIEAFWAIAQKILQMENEKRLILGNIEMLAIGNWLNVEENIKC